MSHLAILQPDPTARALVKGALQRRHDLVEVEGWEELHEIVARGRIHGCILDLYEPLGNGRFDEVERLRRRRPPLAIVIYSDFEGREMDLVRLGRLRVDEVVGIGTEKGGRVLRRTVERALGARMAGAVLAELGGRLEPPADDALDWAIQHAHEQPTVEELAESLRVSPGTLARRLRTRHLPTARALLLWGRLFRATYLIEDGWTVERVAYRLGYSSGAALGRAFREQTGLPPTEITKRGGIPWVLERFARERLQHGSAETGADPNASPAGQASIAREGRS